MKKQRINCDLSISGESISGESISGESISGEFITGESISGESISGDSGTGESISGTSISGSRWRSVPTAPDCALGTLSPLSPPIAWRKTYIAQDIQALYILVRFGIRKQLRL